MVENFKEYVWNDEEIKSPPMNSERTIKKSWLKVKIERIPLSEGAINSRIDNNYSSYEIDNIRELFTEGQLYKLFPEFKVEYSEEQKKANKKKWGVVLLNIFYIFLGLKLTIFILKIIGWKLLLVIFLIIWNLFLKRLWYPIFWSVFGVKFVTQGKSSQEIYELKVLSQSPFRTYIIDGLITPTLLFLFVYSVFSFLNILEDESKLSQDKIETSVNYTPCECADISFKVAKSGGVGNATTSDLAILNWCNEKLMEDDVFLSNAKNCKSYKEF